MSVASEIAELEAILNTGASSVFVNGQKVTYDLSQVRRRLRELRRQLDPSKRPTVATIDLGNF